MSKRKTRFRWYYGSYYPRSQHWKRFVGRTSHQPRLYARRISKDSIDMTVIDRFCRSRRASRIKHFRKLQKYSERSVMGSAV